MKQFTLSGNRICSHSRGFSLVEMMVAVSILAIAIVPMMKAFAPALLSTGIQEETAVFTNQARGTLSRVAALSFETLDSNRGDPVDLAALFAWPKAPDPEEAAKEAFSLKGQTYSPTVAITDASGGEGGLLQLTVRVEDVVLTTYRANY